MSREQSIRTIGLVCCFLALAVITRVGLANIAGSAHDFSAESWNSSGEVCLPCHTSHNADPTITDAPLWNHEVTTATFTLYSSPFLQETPEQPQGTSKLCLSCHDGTVELESFGGNTGSNFIGDTANLSTDLSDDHPISIEWLHQTVTSGSSGSCAQCHGMMHGNPYTSKLPFFDGYVECASCHDVHNTSGYDGLLRMSNAGSALCLYCHTDK
ncbi:cytochrome c3 family protein [Planctomycetota bacterium]